MSAIDSPVKAEVHTPNVEVLIDTAAHVVEKTTIVVEEQKPEVNIIQVNVDLSKLDHQEDD